MTAILRRSLSSGSAGGAQRRVVADRLNEIDQGRDVEVDPHVAFGFGHGRTSVLSARRNLGAVFFLVGKYPPKARVQHHR